MDFGFDGFLDKFEQHFGKWWTKALLLLIGLAAASFCLGVIWNYLIAPIVAFINVPGRLEAIARIMTAGAAVMSGAVLALRIYEWYLNRRLGSYRRSRQALDAQIRATENLSDAIHKLRGDIDKE